jgi:hypothetical protein
LMDLVCAPFFKNWGPILIHVNKLMKQCLSRRGSKYYHETRSV